MNYPKNFKVFFLQLVIYTLILTCMGFTAGCSKKPAKSPKKNSDLQKTRQTFLQFQMNIDKLIKEYETEFLKQVAPAPKPSQQEMQKSQAGTKSQAKGEQQSKDKKDQLLKVK